LQQSAFAMLLERGHYVRFKAVNPFASFSTLWHFIQRVGG